MMIRDDVCSKKEIYAWKSKVKRRGYVVEETIKDQKLIIRCKPHQAAHEAYMQALKEGKERTDD